MTTDDESLRRRIFWAVGAWLGDVLAVPVGVAALIFDAWLAVQVFGLSFEDFSSLAP